MKRILTACSLFLMLLLSSCSRGSDLQQEEIQNSSDNTPQISDVAEVSFEGTTFYYGGRSYDMTSRMQSINSISSVTPVGDDLVIECHTGPQNDVYSIFNTTSETFETDIIGCHLIWYDDDITTAVYSYWSGIYTYKGDLIRSYDLTENQFIYGLAYSDDHTKLNVTIVGDDDTEQIDVIDLSK
jgi:hypothetical protein